ncbi:MAG TPA: hypothetical protein VIH56_03185 [Candidatus Acidoferrales bacterium]
MGFFKKLKDGWGMQPIKSESDSAPVIDVHETFRVNDAGDISGGHTTITTREDNRTYEPQHVSWEQSEPQRTPEPEPYFKWNQDENK